MNAERFEYFCVSCRFEYFRIQNLLSGGERTSRKVVNLANKSDSMIPSVRCQCPVVSLCKRTPVPFGPFYPLVALSPVVLVLPDLLFSLAILL